MFRSGVRDKSIPGEFTYPSLINIHIYPGAVFGTDASVKENAPGVFLPPLINIHIFPGAVFAADASVKENTTPGTFYYSL